jgi:hypothetical protein
MNNIAMVILIEYSQAQRWQLIKKRRESIQDCYSTDAESHTVE